MPNHPALWDALALAVDDTGEVRAPAEALLAHLPEGHPARPCLLASVDLCRGIDEGTSPIALIDEDGALAVTLATRVLACLAEGAYGA